MTLKLFEFINLILCAIVGGMYWGPWLALSRSLKEFDAKIFLILVDRLNKNMETLMTSLTPLSLLSCLPVLVITFMQEHFFAFYSTLAGFLLFLLAMIVTVTIEVPIVKKFLSYTVSTLPVGWEQQRDRWGKFHIIRVLSGIIGLLCLFIAVIFG